MNQPFKQPLEQQDIKELLRFYWDNTQPVSTRRSSTFIKNTQGKCSEFFRRDYVIEEIEIPAELCPHYPPRICIPWQERRCENCFHSNPPPPSQKELLNLFDLSSRGRVRGRFVTPTILFHYTLPNKHQPEANHTTKFIMRSGSLVQRPEAALRNAMTSSQSAIPLTEEQEEKPTKSSMGKWRKGDIYAMKRLGVDFVFDLMIEEKCVRFGIQCASSEKVKHREPLYRSFRLITMPFPGYEYFTLLTLFSKRKMHKTPGTKLHDFFEQSTYRVPFDWVHDCTVKLNVSELDAHPIVKNELLHDVIWDKHQSWNVVHLAQNYLRVMIYMTLVPSQEQDGGIWNGGMLIHCISGWDRTPVFVSLMRITLWADGIVHKSLSALEMLYFTLAYDWMLFGHNLAHRAKDQNVELLYFAFYMLDKITDETFSVHHAAGNAADNSLRVAKLTELQQLFMPLYNEICVLFPQNTRFRIFHKHHRRAVSEAVSRNPNWLANSQ